ncbi:hypothetical protein ACO03_20565 (plasmid) [Pantoea ananatis]|nr:hypothetical protein ACO03_20565 [Pantoea ananatis]
MTPGSRSGGLNPVDHFQKMLPVVGEGVRACVIFNTTHLRYQIVLPQLQILLILNNQFDESYLLYFHHRHQQQILRQKKLFFFARVWQTHKLNILPYRIQSTYDVQLKAMMSFRLQQSRRFHYWLQLRKSF